MTTTPHLGHEAQKLLDATIAAYAEHEARLKQLDAEQTTYFKYGIVETKDHWQEIRKAKSGAFKALISAAEKRFAPAGGSLDIDSFDVLKALGGKDELDRPSTNGEAVNLVAAWDYLEATYGGEKGIEAGHQQLANEIVRMFGLRAGEAPKMVGGKVSIDIRMYLDSLDKKYGQSRYSYSCLEYFKTARELLASLAVWANDNQTSGCLNNLYHQFSVRSEVTSRARFPCGQVDVVTYHNRVEFRLAPALADALMEFVSTYATNLVKKAA